MCHLTSTTTEPPDYPINQYISEILEMLNSDEHPIFLIKAPTGTGKSTQVPQIIWKYSEKYRNITITVPTRAAAAALAKRTAEELGATVGDLVGFKTGYEKVCSDKTKILYTTEATELMHELHDHSINYDDSVIILDELQEWNIPTEAILAWFKRLISSGTKLKLILMSANVDSDGLSEFLGKIPVINVPAKLFNVTQYHRRSKDFIDSIAKLANTGHHVLAFVPGKRDIDQTIELLQNLKVRANFLKLHGDLPLSEQQAVFEQPSEPTVVVSTNIAQTSLTIPYIDAVVDSGLERRMQNIDGLDTLAIGVISKSDYIQRSGRAGRTKPGIYIWCNDVDIDTLPEFPIPDIETGSIDQIVLHLAALDLDVMSIDFFHQPSTSKIAASQKTLRMLGAFDEENRITECGRLMTKLPLSVRFARMIVEAQKRDVLYDVVTLVSILEVGGIKKSTSKYSGYTREMKSDMLAELDVFNSIHQKFIKIDAQPFFTSDQETEDIFADAIERNYHRIRELRAKLENILYGIFGDVSSSGNRTEIFKSCVSGLVEFLYVRESNNWYRNPNDPHKRKLELNTAILPSPYVLGIPKNISVAYNENGENHILYLLTCANMITIPLLEEVAPHLFKSTRRNEFRYATHEYVSKDIRLFGDVEIGSTDSRLSDPAAKRDALITWLATATFDISISFQSKLDKNLKKVFNRNRVYLENGETAAVFYAERLNRFYPNSLPNLRKCKDFAFLTFTKH